MDRELPAAERRSAWLRRGLVIALSALAVLWLASLAIGLLQPSVRRAHTRVSVVERGPIEAVLDATGTIVPSAEQVIPSLVEARILRIVQDPGALLAIGDPILELDVGAATLELGRLENQRAEVQSERVELALTQQERRASLQSTLALRRLDRDELAYNVEQQQRLRTEGLISEAELRATLVRQQKTDIELAQLEESMSTLERSLSAQTARIDARLATLARQVDDARTKAAMATVRADRAGVLTWIVDALGTTVSAGAPLARIADPDQFRIEAVVSEIHAPRLSVGQTVRVPIGGETLTGRIARVRPAVEQRSVRFDVTLDDPAHSLLRPNLRTEVLVVVAQRDDVLRVAKGPFASAPGSQQVFVIEGDRALRRTVDLGLSGHVHWEVVGGLEVGDAVIVSDMSRHQPQTEIRVR